MSDVVATSSNPDQKKPFTGKEYQPKQKKQQQFVYKKKEQPSSVQADPYQGKEEEKHLSNGEQINT